jgi:hypothetical protein
MSIGFIGIVAGNISLSTSTVRRRVKRDDDPQMLVRGPGVLYDSCEEFICGG